MPRLFKSPAGFLKWRSIRNMRAVYSVGMRCSSQDIHTCSLYIISRKLCSKSTPCIPRPISTIFPVCGLKLALELVDLSPSMISNISRTPCTIFTLPSSKTRRAFSRCISTLAWSDEALGTSFSQRMDLSQLSTAWRWREDNGGKAKDDVEMVWCG